jgi:formate/nitrite transporter FocA (FNT family)
LISRPGVMTDGAKGFLFELAQQKVSATVPAAFMKGVFAGWLMTILTWLLLAARGQGARLFIIWIVGFLIAAGHFNHVVISAAEVFIALALGAPIRLATWAVHNFLPALLGNLVGGVVFVTLLGYVQAHTLRQSKARIRETFGRRRARAA